MQRTQNVRTGSGSDRILNIGSGNPVANAPGSDTFPVLRVKYGSHAYCIRKNLLLN